MRSIPSWLRDTPIAHRGLHDAPAVPENSLDAFSAAARAGYPAELDVRLLADGEVVVFHDADCARLCGDSRRVSSLNSGQLAKLRLGSTDQSPPLLRDVLETVAGLTPLLVEIKNEEKSGLLEEKTCRLLSDYDGEYAVQSFNVDTLAWFEQNAPAIILGLLGTSAMEDVFTSVVQKLTSRPAGNNHVSPDFVGYEARFLPFDPVSRVRRENRPVLGWTVRSAEQERQVRAYCDNIIFEGFVPSIPAQ